LHLNVVVNRLDLYFSINVEADELKKKSKNKKKQKKKPWNSK